jgi:hypothetical protein
MLEGALDEAREIWLVWGQVYSLALRSWATHLPVNHGLFFYKKRG